MSFLHEDDTLVKLLIDSGVLADINKYAQDATKQAKQVATKLVQVLQAQSVSNFNNPESELFFKDVVNLDRFLEFLKSNEKRFNNQLLVFNKAIVPEEKVDTQIYVPYKNVYVYKDGLLAYIKQLEEESNKQGQDLLKAPLKNLIEQINVVFKTDYKIEPIQTVDALPPNPYDANTQPTVNIPSGKGSSLLNVKLVQEKEQANKALESELIQTIKTALPFKETNKISPYDMQLFIKTTSDLIGQKKDFFAGPLVGQFKQFEAIMMANYTEWQSFINQIAAENKSDSVLTLRDDVPYDLYGRANEGLERLFAVVPAPGAPIDEAHIRGRQHLNARGAAQRLLQMVNHCVEALISMERAPALMDLLGKDVIDYRLSVGKALASKLAVFAG